MTRRIVDRLLAILQHEGLTGVLDRLRDPKPLRRRRRRPDALRGPVLIQGGSADQRVTITEVLKSQKISLVTAQIENHREVLCVDPDSHRLAVVNQNDILILHDVLCEDELVAAATRCRGLLISSFGTFHILRQNGVPLSKIFLFTDMAEGLTRLLLAFQDRPVAQAEWSIFAALRDLPKVPHICLGLPETVDRRDNFLSLQLVDFRIFDGIRYEPGWIGAGASFSTMAQACLAQGIQTAIFCEDDLKIGPDYNARLAAIHDHLAHIDWDVFSGLLTDIGSDYIIMAVVRHKGEVLVHLNRCVGMVYGIYNERALRQIAAWNAVDGLTIDRHLERADGLTVVTTLPFLVDHHDDLRSSMWHFRNRRYRNLIANSERRLAHMVKQFEAINGKTNSDSK